MKTVRVGTRGSQLARTQTEQVLAALRAQRPGENFELVVIRTTGDSSQSSGTPFAAVGAKGMFVKELEEALLAGDVDFAVHSMKDMPAEIPAGLAIVASPRREDPADALVSNGSRLNELPIAAKVGTSSLRRRVLLKAARPDIGVDELRGNLDTRLRKLADGQYDAILVACAGLERMGMADRITERLDPHRFIPAPGQGALALEARGEDSRISDLLRTVHCSETWDAIRAERAFQQELNAGCTVPAGAYATVSSDTLHLVAFLSDETGADLRRIAASGTRDSAEEIGARAARSLL